MTTFALYLMVSVFITGVTALVTQEDPPKQWPLGAITLGLFWLPLLVVMVLLLALGPIADWVIEREERKRP